MCTFLGGLYIFLLSVADKIVREISFMSGKSRGTFFKFLVRTL